MDFSTPNGTKAALDVSGDPAALASASPWALAALWLALVMAVLDGSIVNVALPAMAQELGAEPGHTIWILNAYQLAIVVSLLPLSALGQRFAFRRVFLTGLALFLIASVGCTLSQTLSQLVTARVAQGFGAAGIMSSNVALLRFIFPSERLGRGLGLNAMVIATAAVIGPSLSALILAFGPWPLLFGINLPIGLIALIIGWFALPMTRRTSQRIDLTSALLNVLAFGMVVIGIDILKIDAAWGGLLFAGGLLAGGLLIHRSRRQVHPLVPVDLMRNPRFALAVATSTASFSAQMLAFVALPFLLEAGSRAAQLQTGLLLSAWPLAVAIAAPVAGRLADRWSSALLATLGMALLAAGLLLLSLTLHTDTPLVLAGILALCGCGFGLFQSPNNRELLNSAPQDRSGAASGMLGMARLTGQITGATLAAVLFAAGPSGAQWCLDLATFAAVVAAGLGAVRVMRLS